MPSSATPTEGASASLLFFQRLIPLDPAATAGAALPHLQDPGLVNLTFNAYLRIAPPDFVGAGSADDQEGAGQQQGDADRRPGVSGTSSRPNRPSRSIATEAVSCPVMVAAATPAGADRADRDQRVGDVDGPEKPAEQVVPADVEGRAEPAGLAAEDDDRRQGERADR